MAAANDAVIIFGGNDGKGDRNDTWLWNGTGWSQQSATGPSTREQTERETNPTSS
jgi:hypothetical protein